MVMSQARGLIMLRMLSLPTRFITIAGMKRLLMRMRQSCQLFRPRMKAIGKVASASRMLPAMYLSGVRKGTTLTGAKGTGSSSMPSERRRMPSNILQRKRKTAMIFSAIML